jgi:hypothetical protein
MNLAIISASIRVDVDTQTGSVIDVIRLINSNLTSGNATNVLNNLTQSLPDISSQIHVLRINGKGKFTPVANVQTIIHIIFELPGKAARDHRRRSAYQICRLLGGDITLIDQIQGRNKWWQQNDFRKSIQKQLLEQPIELVNQGDAINHRVKEHTVRDSLAEAEMGDTECQTPVGYIDVLTIAQVIEVKHYTNWKHALGQVQAYGDYHEDKSKRIHLFADTTDLEAARSTVLLARPICQKRGVEVTLEVLSNKRHRCE